jgi:RNA polymerase sigma factor (sigma-70 family)
MIEDPKPPGDQYSGTAADRAHAHEIDRLFREHNDSLLRFLAARLGSRQEAREIAQEAYVRLLKLDTPGAVSYLRAFLFKTASNLAVDRLRTRNYRERPASLEFFERLPSTATPEREVGGEQEMRELHRLLRELPPKCQYAFVMNRFHGVDVAWLSKDMQITETMVRRYISRALIHCRAGLDVATGSRHDKE